MLSDLTLKKQGAYSAQVLQQMDDYLLQPIYLLPQITHKHTTIQFLPRNLIT